MIVRIVLALALITSSMAQARQPPPRNPPARLLPVNDSCRTAVGPLSSTIGPVMLTLAYDGLDTDLDIERDGLTGYGERSGEVRLTADRTDIFNYTHRLGGGRYVFGTSNSGTTLIEMVATSRQLSVAPLARSGHADQSVASSLASSAPNFTVQLGDLTAPATRLAECGELLNVVNKLEFCGRQTGFYSQQGCPASAWRMGAHDERQVDWIDANHLKRTGTAIEFVVHTQRGTTADVARAEDRQTAATVVRGNCESGSYRLAMFATFDSNNRELAMKVDVPPEAADVLVAQDLQIACSGNFRSAVTSDPAEATGEWFEEMRVTHSEGGVLKHLFGY